MPSTIEAEIQARTAAFTHELAQLVKASTLQAVVEALEGRAQPRRRKVVRRAAVKAPVKTVQPMARARRNVGASSRKAAPAKPAKVSSTQLAAHPYDQARRELLAAM